MEIARDKVIVMVSDKRVLHLKVYGNIIFHNV